MKIVLFLLASIASAQTLTLTSSDSRCSGSPLTCTFLAPGDSGGYLPNDYGVPLAYTTTGGGTWTVGAENQSTCNAALFGFYTQGTPSSTPPTTSTLSGSGTVFMAPIAQVASSCTPGTYTHTITLTHSVSGTYTLTGVQQVINRAYIPVFLNGCGVTDATLSGGAQGNCPGGQTKATPGGNTFTFNLNKVPCSDCRPGGTFNMPAPGSTFRDQLGNLHTVITPVGFVAVGDAEKTNTSVNNTWVMTETDGNATYSGWYVFATTGSVTPAFMIQQADIGNGVFSWSNSDDKGLYGFQQPVPYSGGDSAFQHVTLGAGGAGCDTMVCYTKTTAPGEAAGEIWRMAYTTYGRTFTTAASHQDVNKNGYFPMFTVWDSETAISTSGTAVTKTSGQNFDTNKLLDQVGVIYSSGTCSSPGATVGAFTISAVADTSHLTLTTSAGTNASAVLCVIVPYQLCAFNYQTMDSQGTAYVPVCLDLTTQARPHQNYISSAAYISKDVDPITGKYYISLDSLPGPVAASFTPGDASLTYLTSWTIPAQNNGFQMGASLTGVNMKVGDSSSGVSYGFGTAHASALQTSDGGQWFTANADGAQIPYFKFSSLDAKNMVPYTATSTTGNLIVPLWTQQGGGGEYSGSRKSPFMAASTATPGFPVPVSWNISNCTNASPMVLTLAAGSDTGFNNTTHNKVLVGGVRGNSACNGSQVIASVASSSGSLHDILTLSANGNGAFTAGYGDAAEDVANSTFGNGDVDQIYVIRDLGQDIRRYGHTRGVLYADRVTSAYYAVSRASISMDASMITYTTNNGIPDNLQVVQIATGITNGIGLTSNCFDLTHCVTGVSLGATSATLNYSTPDTSDVIVDVCATQRFPDVPGGSSPDGSCQTLTNTSGANPRTSVISGLTTGLLYWYRIVAPKSTAMGSFTPIASAASAPRVSGASRVYGAARQ